jgi:hypothetical protein
VFSLYQEINFLVVKTILPFHCVLFELGTELSGCLGNVRPHILMKKGLDPLPCMPIRKHETLPLKKSNSRGNNGECTRNAMLHVHLLTSIIMLLYKHGKGVKCKVMFSKSNVMGMYTYVMGSYNSRNYVQTISQKCWQTETFEGNTVCS